MRAHREHLDGLTRLHRIADAEERRGVFRQSLAALASRASDLVPVPLEGLEPGALRESTRAALSAGLVDDLGWLSPAHAAAALYELAAALPAGDEKRELGRRVLRALHDGDAATFVLLATLLASGSRRGLSGPAIRARVALSLDMPIGAGIRADALALALISRRDLADEWLVQPSSGSLPSRRLAARLLERAARESARRVAMGDESVLQIFERPQVQSAWSRLLADREPLVWRHVASARGLLAHCVAAFDAEITHGLSPHLTPTEWRRAAASIASTLAFDPHEGLRRCQQVLESEIVRHDRGIPSAMILGLARAAEAEPEAAEQLLVPLVRNGNLDAIEALLELRSERIGGDFGELAGRLALSRLRDPDVARGDGDDGRVALLFALDADLSSREETGREATLRERLEEAREAFARKDARTAYARAVEVLGAVDQALARLEASRENSSEGRTEGFLALRELDGAMLETSALADLLTLGGGRGDEAGRAKGPPGASALSERFERLTAWLLLREREPVRSAAMITHPTLRMRRLRTLLHAVDADGGFSEERNPELRERRLRAVRVLLARTRDDAPSPLRRIVHAAAARACDAVLREEIAEVSDVLVAVVAHLSEEVDLATFAEASMVPEAETLFRAYATLIERTERSARLTSARQRASAEALRALIRNLPAASSPRVEALRGALLRFASAIDEIAQCSSIAELVGELDGQTGSLIEPLEDAGESLARIALGARRRLGEPLADEAPTLGAALRMLDIAALHCLRGNDRALGDAVKSAIDTLREEIPVHIAEVAATTLARIAGLPPHAPRQSRPSVAPRPVRDAGLPPWLPPSRTLGGFYVLRALGSGAVGSVFVARRVEEKHLDSAAKFALKVPEFSGNVARTLSEQEFLQLFREEAGALLAVPQHENLARLVTFDAGAQPKPILVMELIEGPTLERLVETSALDMPRAVAVLDGVARGLIAMHDAGVGHLDLKPSNVILRDPDGPGPALETPVLVDFGLAGRKVRPGCATANYGAPEIWGLIPKGTVARPQAADTYAFGCMAFEALTGRTLFDGDSEVSIITSHLQHDGDLPELDALAKNRELMGATEMIRGALRQDPKKRLTMRDAHAMLAEAAPILARQRWPLAS